MNRDSARLSRPFRWVLIGLALIAVVPIGVIVVAFLVSPEPGSIHFEAAKASMQILGIVVIGGIVSFAASEWQARREQLTKDIEDERKEFNLRTTLLDATSRCAQRMYVTCQHVSRMQRGQPSIRRGGGRPKLSGEASDLLNKNYLEFSTEAAALQTELGARYGINTTDDTVGCPGEAHLRWHQIYDLLTVYYFNLRGLRKGILARNSRSDHAIHSGLHFVTMVEDENRATAGELRFMREEIRKEFERTIPLLANAVLDGELRNV